MSAEEPTRAQEEKKEKKGKRVKLSEEEYQNLLGKAKELEETRDRLLRQAADFDNAKKRLLKEKTEFVRFANQGLLHGLLPIVDNLERAINHCKEGVGETNSSLWEGIDLIRKQLMAVLQEFGLKKIEVLGKRFDPHFHEAVAWVENDEIPENTILEEMVSGYLLHERVLRAAKVKVAKRKGGGALEPREKKSALEQPGGTMTGEELADPGKQG